MNGLIRKKIKESGFKYKFLAEKIGVHPQFFSMVMRGERGFSLEKENALKSFLDKIPA